MSDLCDIFVHQNLRMSVIRHRVEVDVDVPTVTVSNWQSDRVVWFAAGLDLSRLTHRSPFLPESYIVRSL